MTDERKGSVAYSADKTSHADQRIAIESAEGLALGLDGLMHPIEVDGRGQMRGVDKTTNQLLEELIGEIRALRLGMVATGACEDTTGF